MFDLFLRLKTPRTRVIAERQIEILKTLLDAESLDWPDLIQRTTASYARLKNPIRALIRDVNGLAALGAVRVARAEDQRYVVSIRLEWPAEITETDFFRRVKELPKAKTHAFLA
jgi:hypothetical protein